MIEIPYLPHLRELNDVPMVHPNGFLQLDLTGDRTKRLHVFDDSIPRQTQRTAIHDHIFDMTSHVLLGELFDNSYDAIADDDGDYEVHQARHVQCEETNLFPIGQRVRLEPIQTRRIIAGHQYGLHAFVFHLSVPNGRVVTIMEKTQRRVGTAKVLVPVGAQPDNAFSRMKHDHEAHWQLVADALEEARGARRA